MNANYFKSLGNIETSYRLLRSLMFIVMGVSACLALGVSYWAFTTVDKSRERVYVMEGGKSIMLALAQEHNINRPAEAKDHCRSFIKLLFELEPDEAQIKKSIEQATYMGDKASVFRLYTDLKEKGYYNQLIQGDVHQKVEIDLGNINVNMERSPFYFRAKGKQILIRATTLTIRNLEMEGYLVETQRTDNNTHGFNIERFKILDNRDIETVTRAPEETNL